jgi:quercetin dioxygenase-like cupin family protein
MLTKPVLVAALLALLTVVAPAAASGQPGETREHRLIPIKPMSQDVEILYGDPEKEGEPFVMRIRELPGTIIPPHKHPVDEHITVVQGTIYFAVAEKFDRAALKEIKAGGYAFIPKGRTMFGYIPDGAIVQVHGTGPFHALRRRGRRLPLQVQEGRARRLKAWAGPRPTGLLLRRNPPV